MKTAEEWVSALNRSDATATRLFGSKTLGEIELERKATGTLSIKGNFMAGSLTYDGPIIMQGSITSPSWTQEFKTNIHLTKGDFKFINPLENKNKKKIKIKVPGTSKLHYSPGIPVRLNAKKNYQNEAYILIKKRKKLDKNYFYISKTSNLKQAAKNLYKTLRIIKKKGYKKIAIEKIPNINIGEAINDRILRASKK